MLKNNAFSLIELLVVVAIISVLASIAVPAYQQYSFISKMSQIKQMGFNYLYECKRYYDLNGSTPSSLFNIYPSGQVTPIQSFSSSLVNYVYYDGNVFDSSAGAKTCAIELYIGSSVGSYIPSFQASTGASSCTYCKLQFGFKIQNGVYLEYCGAAGASGDTSFIPINYFNLIGCKYDFFF